MMAIRRPKTETYQEYRMIWDYPFVRNLGEVRYGRVARTPEAAYGNVNDEGWDWAGEYLGMQERTVIYGASEWQETEYKKEEKND